VARHDQNYDPKWADPHMVSIRQIWKDGAGVLDVA